MKMFGIFVSKSIDKTLASKNHFPSHDYLKKKNNLKNFLQRSIYCL